MAKGLRGPEASSSHGDILDISYQGIAHHVAFCNWLLALNTVFARPSRS